jgi:hypothetical protein
MVDSSKVEKMMKKRGEFKSAVGTGDFPRSKSV